jgi:hypothetical protein
MGFRFDDLDLHTRALMLDEVDRDTRLGVLYRSPRLSPLGQVFYVRALREAVGRGNERTLAAAIASGGMLNTHEISHRRGKVFAKRVPCNAHLTLAEGEFNRFYLRALCLRMLEDGHRQLEIYRAKQVASPRPESQAQLGTRVDVHTFLSDLRKYVGVDTTYCMPAPNSGLSARVPLGIAA